MDKTETRISEVNIGISEKYRDEISDGLSHLLADTYTLYLKSQNYHWNVTGPQFHSLHEMFEEHYKELAEAVDALAEGIRALGHFAPGTLNQFSEMSSVSEEYDVPDAMEMINRLVMAHEQIMETARKVVSISEEADDQTTLDLVTERLKFHSKTAWMLRSHLQ
ncbi:MAG: Dps family protein [Balneolales bacterium]